MEVEKKRRREEAEKGRENESVREHEVKRSCKDMKLIKKYEKEWKRLLKKREEIKR